MPASESQKNLVLTPDGWAVAEFDYVRFFLDHSPPRPHVFLRQLIADAKCWKVIAFWVVGFGLITLAIVVRQWQVILLGLLVLSVWVRLFWRHVRSLRNSPLLVGVIDGVEHYPHPFVRNYSTARARLADGREVSVYLSIELLTLHALELIEEQGRAEVLFFDDPTGGALVVGVRAMPGFTAIGTRTP